MMSVVMFSMTWSHMIIIYQTGLDHINLYKSEHQVEIHIFSISS
jgi:hypothetical protein